MKISQLTSFVVAVLLLLCYCLAIVQDAVAAMSELELLFKYLDAMGTLKVREIYPVRVSGCTATRCDIDPLHLGR